MSFVAVKLKLARETVGDIQYKLAWKIDEEKTTVLDYSKNNKRKVVVGLYDMGS